MERKRTAGTMSSLPIALALTLLGLVAPALAADVRPAEGVISSVTIPRERWQLQPPIGSRWDYKDPNGVVNGVRKMRVKRIVKHQPRSAVDRAHVDPGTR
jgi:hypothetical protein